MLKSGFGIIEREQKWPPPVWLAVWKGTAERMGLGREARENIEILVCSKMNVKWVLFLPG